MAPELLEQRIKGGEVSQFLSTPHQHATRESHCPCFCNCSNPLNDGDGDCVWCGRIIKTANWRQAA